MCCCSGRAFAVGKVIVPICISYSPFLRRSYPRMLVGCVGAAGLVGTNAGAKAFVGASLVVGVGVVVDSMVGVIVGTWWHFFVFISVGIPGCNLYLLPAYCYTLAVAFVAK